MWVREAPQETAPSPLLGTNTSTEVSPAPPYINQRCDDEAIIRSLL